jgi:hypothetical protein
VTPKGYRGIFEDEMYQLGQVAVSTLAMTDIRFVPHYIRFLKSWDLGHEVMQSQDIEQIFSAHGICPETEELLYVRAVETGYGTGQIEVLFPVLQAHYGDFTKSDLFRKIVRALHAKDRAWRVEEHEEYLARLAKNPDAKPRLLSERYIFSYCPSAPALEEAAKRLLEEFDMEAGPLPSAK